MPFRSFASAASSHSGTPLDFVKHAISDEVYSFKQVDIANFSNQFTTLPALLSKPDCQRTQILRCLSSMYAPGDNREFRDDPSTLGGDASKVVEFFQPAYAKMIDRFLQVATTETLTFLLASRSDIQLLISFLKGHSETESNEMKSLKALDHHWRHVLQCWFSPSILRIERISYDHTPALVVERVVRNEAVHPVQSLEDLQKRLGPTRRVYALMHPLLPDRPLVVLHVSLQENTIPASMSAIHEAPLVDQPQVAAFYSISNIERGLAGVGLGEVLIHETVGVLRREWPTLRDFVTLSPLPGFRKWLGRQEQIAADDRPGDSDLERLAAEYLVQQKGRHGKPLDPVACFHLRNGAEVFRINLGADLSKRGENKSWGVMVNYRYDLERIVTRRQRYRNDPKDFDVHASIKGVLSEEENNFPRAKL